MITSIFPQTVTTFIGREQELADLEDLLRKENCRLLTIVGPGGIGKTRLALEIFNRISSEFPDGVHFIPLSSIKSTNELIPRLLQELNFQPQENTNAWQELIRYLSTKMTLLIFDNFEVILESSDTINQILAHAPNLKILVTSREPLSLIQEWTYQISGLAFPEKNNTPNKTDYDAIKLFYERARQHNTPYLDQSMEDIIKICQKVDGIPLAIELAASWLNLIPINKIVPEIDKNIDFLTSQHKDIQERHRSMRAVINESWDLLGLKHQNILKSLSIISTNFTAEAADAIAGASFYDLSELTNKSLLQIGSENRYVFHELVKKYAYEKLENDPAQMMVIQKNHCRYFANRLSDMLPDLQHGEQNQALNEIAKDFLDIQKAWKWAVSHKRERELEKMLDSFFLFTNTRGFSKEFSESIEHAIATFKNQFSEPYPLILGMLISRRKVDKEFQETLIEDVKLSYQIAKAHENRAEMARSLFASGNVHVVSNNIPQAINDYQDSLQIYEDLNDEYYIAYLNATLGVYDLTSGDYPNFFEKTEKSLLICQSIGNKMGEGHATNNIAAAYFNTGNFTEAEKYYLRVDEIYNQLNNKPGISYSKANISSLALFKGDFPSAKRWADEALKLANEINHQESQAFAETILAAVECLQNKNFAKGKHLSQTALEKTVNIEISFYAKWVLSIAAVGLGQIDEAKALNQETVQYTIDAKSPVYSIICLPIAAAILAEEKKYTPATKLLSFAMAQANEINGWMKTNPYTIELGEKLKKELSPSKYQEAVNFSETANLNDMLSLLTKLQICEYCLPLNLEKDVKPVFSHVKDSGAIMIEPLSIRELQIFKLLMQGLSNQEIADRLTISLGTVKTHIHNIYGKLGVSGRTKAIAKAKRLKILN
jgi:predicted ATPase/DNA-binding CsgD family transcriptional regulator